MANFELKGLRGLKDLDALNKANTGINNLKQNLNYVPTSSLSPGKFQPRRKFLEESILELAESIKCHGIIQPLIVRKLEKEKYEIIAGERRWRAAQIVNLQEIPVIIRIIEDNVALAFSLIENIQREALNPIEEALAYARLRDDFSMSHASIAETTGKSRTTITNTLRLLCLSNIVKDLLIEGKLEMGHARAFLTLDTSHQESLALKTIEDQLTVRQVERLVNQIKKHDNPINKPKNLVAIEVEKDLSEILHAKVNLKINHNWIGKVIININSKEELDFVINKLKNN